VTPNKALEQTHRRSASRDSEALREVERHCSYFRPAGAKEDPGFNDEALGGDWKDHRSSRLNQQYRVIYRIQRDAVLVEVVNVTAHDYRRK
jgi:addiction module RelE/StbE family toxin